MARAAETPQESGLDEIIAAVNSEFEGGLKLLEGTSRRWPADRLIRTGSLALDMAIGIGGLPRGRVVHLYGPYSSGKTTLALNIALQAQAAGLLTLFVDAEHALDPVYAKSLGLKTESMLITQPDYQEQAIDIINRVLEYSEGRIGPVIVDSVPALVPRVVYEEGADKETMGVRAKKWSEQLPRVVGNVGKAGAMLILLNQLRSNMSPYGPPESIPGGQAIQFYNSVSIKLTRWADKKADGIEYQTTSFDVVKNKVGSPFRKGQFDIWPGYPIDRVSDVYETAIAHGVILSDSKLEWGPEYPREERVETKKNHFLYWLQPGDIDLVLQDDPEADPDMEAITAYQNANFWKKISRYPSLFDSIEEQVLQTLDSGASISSDELDEIDTETDADPVDVEEGPETVDVED